MWSVFFITITWCVARGEVGHAEQVSNTAPPVSSSSEVLPDSPEAVRYPDARPITNTSNESNVVIEADYKKWAHAHFTLEGHVHLTYQTRTVEADHAEYDENTGEATLEGHVLAIGGENDERIQASHATMNLRTATGRFYDVSGSVGLRPAAPGRVEMVYANGNPFRFTGRMVVKTGPHEVYDGTVTSCQLPRPDWVLSAAKFTVDADKARATNSIFHLFNLPLLYLPYVTHPRRAEGRQSGFLIPVIGDSSSKGLTLGEQFYWAINRSTDLTVGTIYYSSRGWSQTARFQYKGLGENFARVHYSQLQDRGYTPTGGNYTNQGGVDLTFSGRRDLVVEDAHDTAAGAPPAQQTRGVADVEYLSSFVYREAFTDNFNQAVSSDIVSLIYGIHEWNGYAASLEADRYQGEKRVAQYNARGIFQPEQQVHIFHVPTLQLSSVDRHLGRTPIEWNVDTTLSGLKRVQPNFTTSGIIERFDLRPEAALPFGGGGWRFRPSVAVRETVYSRSRVAGLPGPGTPPAESTEPVNRSSTEFQFEVRPPTIERTFTSGPINRLLRHDVKHTIEPELTYRYVTGVNNFSSILRFDTRDVVSNTNELQYGVTQRLFLRQVGGACQTSASMSANANEVLGPTDAEAHDTAEGGDIAAGTDTSEPGKVCGTREWISWSVGQKYFFNPNFGGSISTGPRNVLDTSLSFTGIAFVTRPRDYSPVISRLRIRTSAKTEVEWDFDYDFCAAAPPTPNAPPPPAGYCNKTFASNNVFADVHQGRAFGGVSYAWLNAPAVSYIDGVRSAFAQFDQMRILLGWGNPSRPGLSAAANAGLDLNLGTVQYGALQTSYNWNCCGFSVEYRKYELGTARNENAYRFNFTLANIGTAGNLRRAQQVF
jgi:LPS-assembly protein